MILPIHIFGNKILNQPGKLIDKDYKNLSQLIDDMFETMYSAGGIGLAAHQIGLPIKLFVIDITNYKEGDESLIGFKKVFINSEIIEELGEEYNHREGCLSFPNIYMDIKRRQGIKLKYLDENFVEHVDTFYELAARCIQHEHDHSNGILFTSRTSPLRRKLLESKFKNLAKGNFSTSYKYKI